MNRPLLTVAAVGVAGFAVWKLASVLLLPLVGALLGLLFTVLKVAAIGGLIWFAYWLITRKKDKGDEAPAT